jgi:c(7)-type cytochrome triheme protein
MKTRTATTPSLNRPRNKRGQQLISLVVLIAGCLGGVFIFFSNFHVSALTTTMKDKGESAEFTAAQESGKDFSKFDHRDANHSRLPCLLCHRRDNNSPQPTRSLGHTPCAGCHTEQFAAPSGPMCTICHVNIESGNKSIKPFPSLKSFNVKFNHSLHTRGATCATCHKPANRNVAFSIPVGLNAHTTCFQCHSANKQVDGRDISSCHVCHQIGRYSRPSINSKAYKIFSHAKHGRSQNLNCNSCHQIRAGSGARQVTSPVPVQHNRSLRAQSCLTCHNDKRAFGGYDFTDCKRCHLADDFRH